MEKPDSLVRGHILHMRSLRDEPNGSPACNDADPRPTLRERVHPSLFRLNHWLPRGQTHPEVMQGTAQFHYDIADARLPQTDPVFDNATALDTAVDMLDPQPAVVQSLVGH